MAAARHGGSETSRDTLVSDHVTLNVPDVGLCRFLLGLPIRSGEEASAGKSQGPEGSAASHSTRFGSSSVALSAPSSARNPCCSNRRASQMAAGAATCSHWRMSLERVVYQLSLKRRRRLWRPPLAPGEGADSCRGTSVATAAGKVFTHTSGAENKLLSKNSILFDLIEQLQRFPEGSR